MSDVSINLDLSALEAEIKNMSPTDIMKQLVEIRTKQRVAQKKYHNPEKAKAYQQKRNAKNKAMADAARALPATEPGYANLYDQILAQASTQADAALAAEQADAAEPVEA
jgi:hypothetical protein